MNPKYLLLVTVFLFLQSCGGGSGTGTGFDTPSNDISDKTATATSSKVAHPKINNLITFDILGGVFSLTSAEVEASIFSDGAMEMTDAGKTSANLTPPPSNQTLSESMTIDASYSFSGRGGHGGLTLIATGSGEKIYPSSTAAKPDLYRYSPMTLRFRFSRFAFDNACLGTIRLDGEITCTIEGDYHPSDQKFVGSAECINGPAEKPASIIYMAPDTNYSVALNAVLTIDGDPFQYESYKYEGEITIDGASKKIEDLIGKGLSCS